MDPRSVAQTYFTSWQVQDFDTLRSILAESVTFQGPLGTAENRDECLAGLTRMAGILTRIEIVQMWVDDQDVLTWFELHTKNASPAPTANWMHIEDGRITRIRVTFDPRELVGG